MGDGKGNVECGRLVEALWATRSDDRWELQPMVCENDLRTSRKSEVIRDCDGDDRVDVIDLGEQSCTDCFVEKSFYTDDRREKLADMWSKVVVKATANQAEKYQMIYDADRKRVTNLLKWLEAALERGEWEIVNPDNDELKTQSRMLGFQGPDGKTYKVEVGFKKEFSRHDWLVWWFTFEKGRNGPDMAKLVKSRRTDPPIHITISRYDDRARSGVEFSYEQPFIPKSLREKLLVLMQKFLPAENDQK